MVLLACLNGFLNTSLQALGLGQGKGPFTFNALLALMYYTWVFLLFLLPFLGKDKTDGWMLLVYGLVMTVLLHVLVFVSPIRNALNSEGATDLRGWLHGVSVRYSAHPSFFIMLTLGGLYCLLPDIKSKTSK